MHFLLYPQAHELMKLFLPFYMCHERCYKTEGYFELYLQFFYYILCYD